MKYTETFQIEKITLSPCAAMTTGARETRKSWVPVRRTRYAFELDVLYVVHNTVLKPIYFNIVFVVSLHLLQQ